MLSYYQDIKPILTKQRFRQKQARHQVVFKSAMGKMTGGSVGTLCFWSKTWFTIVKPIQICMLNGAPHIYRFIV